MLFSISYNGMSSFPLTFIFFKMIIAPPTRCHQRWRVGNPKSAEISFAISELWTCHPPITLVLLKFCREIHFLLGGNFSKITRIFWSVANPGGWLLACWTTIFEMFFSRVTEMIKFSGDGSEFVPVFWGCFRSWKKYLELSDSHGDLWKMGPPWIPRMGI